ncbi:MAG: 2-oxoisovalerate dehydrogenase component alpha subunit [Thermomicrobiales bacterium]|jgi:2-oxoisovalerate dehydrogenase E1 component alpha subunit|nr:2-oxoisovalerate dehydrogenase component alpha subunit [Thermomicrobiales bacterium]
MATGTTQTPSKSVQGAFQAGAVAPNGNDAIHLPLDHVDVGAGTITATVAPPSAGDAGLSQETLREMYTFVALARALDERIWQLNRAGKAPFVVSGQGHEAAQVGAAFALDRSKDIIFPYYRDLALSLVFGLSSRDVMMGVLARGDDPVSGARQMPAHYGSAKLRIISGSSVVGTQIPQATGTAYAAKLRGTGQVSLVAFGEGATSEGDFHEACNFAGIHDLPVIFFCENNRYAISVPQSKQVAIDNIADRASGYGFPGVVVDGTDLLAVYQVVKDAADRARRGDGPTLVEAKLYRFHPHSSDDDDRFYRNPDEVKAWRAHDPLARFEAHLRELGALDHEASAEIAARIRREVDDATDAAEQAPQPDPATFDRYVYAER